MKTESVVFAVTGTLFGLIVGWIIGTQQVGSRQAAPLPQTATAPAAAPGSKPMLDENQVNALRNIAERDPKNVESRVNLGNLYFDAERYPEAIQWYEAALALSPNDPNVSTDLGVSYYYIDQPDQALAAFQRSLTIDPRHTKTWLNMGVVRAFGKQDLAGAVAAWEEVIRIAPDSQEGQTARRFVDNMKTAHPGGQIPTTGAAQGGKQGG
ncbi:MAG: tetratricopeptide repeat protein [Acidobacteriota bacterium]